MTKEEFKNKYHGKSIKIKQSMSETFQSLGGVSNRIKEICEFMELETYQIIPPQIVPSSCPLIAIIDRQQEFKTIDEPPILIDEQEFLSDFKESYEDLQFSKAKKLLTDFKIEYEEIRKSSKTLKDIINIGFIQAQTSNEASLWWHPDGKRIFFVRGQGAFSLTDKKLINKHE